MAVLHNKPSRRGGTRPRLWIDPNPSNPASSLPTPASSVSGYNTNTLAGPLQDTDTATPTSAELFYVLCLYDYDAEDSDQLSFRRNDILDVVKKEDTGWWAAIHPDENRAGWIPSAFVEPISDTLADKLRNNGGNVQIFDETDQFQGSPQSLSDPFIVSSEGDHRGYDWMPLVNGDKVPIMQLGVEPNPPGIANMFSPLVPPHEGIGGPFVESEAEFSPTDVITSRRKAMQLPTQIPVPIEEIIEESQVLTIPPAPVEETPLPATPRTPSRRRSLSLPSSDTPPTEHQRSRSESAKPHTVRHLRRRPLLIDDQSSLNRLTTLFESQNLEELDHLIMSPVVTESMDAFSRTNRAAGLAPRHDKVKQLTGEDEAQAFHDAKLIQSTWYLRPLYGEHEIQFLPEGGVSAGTLRALVERLTLDFSKPVLEMRYRQAFLTTYKSFTTAEEVFDLLASHFNITPPTDLNSKELEQWKDKKQKPTRRRVLAVVQAWVDEYHLLQDDPYLARAIVDLVSVVDSPPQLASTAQDIFKSLGRYISVIPPTPVSAAATRHKRGKSSKDLIRMDTLLIAELLCLHEQKIYSKIRPQECMDWVKSHTSQSVKNLVAFNALHEKLGAWVKLSILSIDGLGKRAETVDWWIKVAEKCKTLNNYASMHALVVALSSPVISRLHLTWAHVNRRSQLEQLAKYHEPTGNFSAYRLFQRSATGPCIPHIAMYLSDLQLANEQSPDNVLVAAASSPLGTTVSLINFAKREKWWEAIDAMLRHQAKPYLFSEDMAVAAYIDTHLAQAAEKDQGSFWMKSQEIQQAEMQHADIRKGLELAGF